MTVTTRSRQGLVWAAGWAVALPLIVGQGCPMPGGSTTGSPAVVVRSPSLNQTLSVGELVTVVYDVTGGSGMTVSAFYDRDGVANSGDESVFNTNLASGENRFVQLATAQMATGALRVGITATNSQGSVTAYAPGQITLVAGPRVSFTSPGGPVRVGAGFAVPIQFSAGVLNFSYRTFYDQDGILDGDEVTIAQQTVTNSATASSEFNTTGLEPGSYFLGATVTTPAGGTASGYATGTVSIVTGTFVQLLGPTVGLIAEPGAFVQIIVAASDPATPSATVRIFYDGDSTFGNGNEITITTIPVTGSGTTWDTSDVSPGSYYIGAELQNGLTPPQVSYSAGPVQLGEAGEGPGGGVPGGNLLTVTTPRVDTTILVGNPYRINWVTSLKSGEGTITLFRESDADNDGQADGAETRQVIGAPGIDASTQFLDFDTTGAVGTFFIGATLTPNTGPQLTAYATGRLTIRPRIFWVGDLRTKKDASGLIVAQSGPFQGAVFEGVNPYDNLGSAMLVADDYDGDRRNEIVIAAQYAKPWNFSFDGRGPGEAYMLYGSAQRYSGQFKVNRVGAFNLPGGAPDLPGTIFTGIVPNPWQGDANTFQAKAGNSIPYAVDGQVAGPFSTEGLRSMTLIPDQDGDGKREIVFGFPYCNSYSLENQAIDGMLPDPIVCIGRLENNGHFLRGGLVTVSSQNPLLNSRAARSRHLDRVIQLHQVGQVFSPMCTPGVPNFPVHIDACEDIGGEETVIFPCDGFTQSTSGLMGPPRLADPLRAFGSLISPDLGAHGCLYGGSSFGLLMSQIDPPASPATLLDFGGQVSPGEEACDPVWPQFGTIALIGTGFYSSQLACGGDLAEPREPFGYRLLGQVSSQPFAATPTVANRFGSSVSTSGDFLLVGAPRRTATRTYVPLLPSASREEAGEIYMISMQRPGGIANEHPYALPGTTPSPSIPHPHTWIVEDIGYNRYDAGCDAILPFLNSARFELSNPFRVVGAAPGDNIGEVVGTRDINADGVEDFVVGGAGTQSGRGAVYVIYRRQPEVEGDYLLERLQYGLNHPDRLNGLMIIGEPGENLGTSLGGGGALADDFNDDGFSDFLIGSPNSSPAAGFRAGQVFVLFGGKNLLNPAGGSTIAQLRASGDGMLITGAYAGEMAGTTVANAGDVNADGVPDILIAAPEGSPRFDLDDDGFADTIGLDFNGDKVPDDLDGNGAPDDMTNAGLVYIVYGGTHLTGTISLSQIGTADLPGMVIVGRKGGDRMGGGLTRGGLLSRGVSPAGDLDGDNRADLLISSIQADPDDLEDAGEVYLIYGFTP